MSLDKQRELANNKAHEARYAEFQAHLYHRVLGAAFIGDLILSWQPRSPQHIPQSRTSPRHRLPLHKLPHIGTIWNLTISRAYKRDQELTIRVFPLGPYS